MCVRFPGARILTQSSGDRFVSTASSGKGETCGYYDLVLDFHFLFSGGEVVKAAEIPIFIHFDEMSFAPWLTIKAWMEGVKRKKAPSSPWTGF